MLHKRHIDPECHYCCWQSGCFGLVFQYNLQYAVSWTLPLKEYLIMPFAFLMQSIFTTVRMKDPCWLCCRTGVIWAIETEGDLNAVLSVGGGGGGEACAEHRDRVWLETWPPTELKRKTEQCVCVCAWRRAAKRFPVSFLMHFNTWQAILIPALTSNNS